MTATRAALPEPVSPGSGTRSCSMLLVAGEPDQAAYWELIFGSLGFRVRLASTLQAAEDALRASEDIHIIACDSLLRDGTGVQFFERLRTRPDVHLVYLILLTSHSEEVAASLRAGANDCLQIGASYGEIRARLELAERVIGLTRALDQKSTQLDDALRVLQAELTAATRLQAALLPRRLQHGGHVFETFYAAAGALGGDMVGVTAPIQGCIAFGLVDVVGHGTASALISCSLIRELKDRLSAGLIRGDRSERLRSGLEVITELNRRYCEFGLPGMYFTALAGVIEVTSGELAWCQAGHPSLLLFDPENGWLERNECGYPVGLIDGAEYELHRLTLMPGHSLLAFSDGLLRQTPEDPGGTAALIGRLRTVPATPESVVKCLADHASTASGPERDDQSALLVARAHV